MKNLLIILSLCLFSVLSLSQSYGAPGVTPPKDTVVKVDTPKVAEVAPVVANIVNLLGDSATQAEAIIQYQNAQELFFNPPVKGSSWWTWIKYIFGWFLFLGFINGCITRAIPTEYRSKYKWLRWTENIFEFILKVIKLVPNRSKINGVIGKHND